MYKNYTKKFDCRGVPKSVHIVSKSVHISVSVHFIKLLPDLCPLFAATFSPVCHSRFAASRVASSSRFERLFRLPCAIRHARQSGTLGSLSEAVLSVSREEPTHTLPDCLPAHARTFVILFDEYELSQNYLTSSLAFRFPVCGSGDTREGQSGESGQTLGRGGLYI